MKLRCLAAAMAAVVLAGPGLTVAAAPDQLSPQAKAWGVMTAKTAFNAARTCFEQSYLTLAVHESKALGVRRNVAETRIAQTTTLDAASKAAIALGYEIDRVTDQRLKDAFEGCLVDREKEVTAAGQ